MKLFRRRENSDEKVFFYRCMCQQTWNTLDDVVCCHVWVCLFENVNGHEHALANPRLHHVVGDVRLVNDYQNVLHRATVPRNWIWMESGKLPHFPLDMRRKYRK